MKNVFSELITKINNKKKPIELKDEKTLAVMNAILGDYDEKEASDKFYKNLILSDDFQKDNYCFKIILIPRNIPVKQPTPLKFDFEMKKVYCVLVAISDSNDCCDITLEKEEKLDSAKEKYNFWKEFILNNNCETIISYIKEKI